MASVWDEIQIKAIAGVEPVSRETANSIMANSYQTWKLMNLTDQQIAYGIATFGLESTFNPNLGTTAGPGTAYGLGQFTQGTWNQAVHRFNNVYGVDMNAAEARNVMEAQIVVMGTWIQKEWTIASKYFSDPNIASGISLEEIAYALHHDGTGISLDHVNQFFNDPIKYNNVNKKGYFRETVGQATAILYDLNPDNTTQPPFNVDDYDLPRGRFIQTSATSYSNVYTAADGSQAIETFYADGSYSYSIYDAQTGRYETGTLDSSQVVYIEPHTPSMLETVGPTLIDALSLIKAIQTGEPLPILASGLRLANDFSPSATLSGAASLASGALSILSLENALQRGDAIAAVTAGAQAVSFGAQAYANFLGKEFGQVFAADSFIGEINQTLPYLALVNDIAHGDALGVAIDVMYFIPPLQPIAIALSVARLVFSLFGGDDAPPEPWGTASAAWSGDTAITQSSGGDGGQETVHSTFQNLISYLDHLAAYEQSVNPGSTLGVVANRLPTISYRNYTGFQLTDIDPLTGAQRYPDIHYDLDGRPYDAPPGSEQASQSLNERFLRVALARGAVAPLWEVQTAAIQTQYGDPQAGLSEEERAGRNGQLAAPPSGPSQTFRPVALDLNGDGVHTTGNTKTVAFDVDDSGYLKNTAWLNTSDAFLFLDRNLNGRIDTGKELFNNSLINVSQRGLQGMRWIDSNYDGKLTSSDPVWNELKVWRDGDGDGTQDAGEVNTLSALGITELNYSLGRFVQNGQLKEMSSPDLSADTAGTRTHTVPEGIVIETTGGQTSLLVTRIDDRTVIEANRDGVTSYEDIETIISGADLTGNDAIWLDQAA